MKTLTRIYLAFLVVLIGILPAQAVEKNLNQFTELNASPAPNDYIFLWDADAPGSRKLTIANLFNAPSFTGVGTVGGTWLETPASMAALVVDITKANNTKSDNANRTITFSGTPSDGQWFGLLWVNTDTSSHAITLPAGILDGQTGASVASITVPAASGGNNGRRKVIFERQGSVTVIHQGGGGGVVALTPWSENIEAGGYNLNDAGVVTADNFVGPATGLTSIPAPQLVGTIPDIATENLTTARNNIITPTTGVSNVVVTDDGQTNITLDATTETLTYSATPTTGAWFRYALIAHTSDCVVTIPSTYSYAVGGNRTSFNVRANKNAYVVCHRTASGYEMWGDPVEIGDLAHDSTPATTSKIEIDQGAGGEYASLAELWTNANIAAGTASTPSAGDNDTSVATTAFVQTEIDGTATGSWAAPYTTASSLSPTWSGPIYAVYMGVAQTVILPDAAAYAQRGIVVYSTGAFVLTVDPDSDDFIVRDGTAQSDGVTITVTAAAGNYVCLLSDGTNWITLGYKGTLAQGS